MDTKDLPSATLRAYKHNFHYIFDLIFYIEIKIDFFSFFPFLSCRTQRSSSPCLTRLHVTTVQGSPQPNQRPTSSRWFQLVQKLLNQQFAYLLVGQLYNWKTYSKYGKKCFYKYLNNVQRLSFGTHQPKWWHWWWSMLGIKM